MTQQVEEKLDFKTEKINFAKWRIIRAVQDWRDCLKISDFDHQKGQYVRLAEEEMLKRLHELEVLGGESSGV